MCRKYREEFGEISFAHSRSEEDLSDGDRDISGFEIERDRLDDVVTLEELDGDCEFAMGFLAPV